MSSMFNFQDLKEKVQAVEEWLQKELSLIRTGRAAPFILDSVQVDAYGGKMLIKELGSVVLEDAKTLRIEPWDQAIGKSIEKAIIASNLGLSVSPYDKGLRIIFPDLTAERREQFVKLARTKLEEGRVTLRGLRDKQWKAIEEKEKSGGMGEDDKFRFKDELQKIIDSAGTKLEELTIKKESEIKS